MVPARWRSAAICSSSRRWAKPAVLCRMEQTMPETAQDDPLRSALFTDLYELAMAQAYEVEGMEDQAAFELFFREMPAKRNYFIAAGLDDVLTYLEGLHFTDDDL